MAVRNFTFTAGLTDLVVVGTNRSTGATRYWYTVTPAFETYNAAHIASYAIAVTEAGPGLYEWTIPAQWAAGTGYKALLYQKAGGSLAASDLDDGALREMDVEWDGSAELSLATVPQDVVEALPAQEAPDPAPIAEAVAAAILVTPANKIAVDADNAVTTNNPAVFQRHA